MSGAANGTVIDDLREALRGCISAMCKCCCEAEPNETCVNGCEYLRIAKAALARAENGESDESASEAERLRGEVARLRADYQCLMQRLEAERRETVRLRAALGQEEARA